MDGALPCGKHPDVSVHFQINDISPKWKLTGIGSSIWLYGLQQVFLVWMDFAGITQRPRKHSNNTFYEYCEWFLINLFSQTSALIELSNVFFFFCLNGWGTKYIYSRPERKPMDSIFFFFDFFSSDFLIFFEMFV